MAGLLRINSRLLYSACLNLTAKRAFALQTVCQGKKFADPLEHATGLEKAELLAALAGNDDPYECAPRKRGAGTKDTPNVVPSFFEKRIVGCICDEDQTHINWMWVHEGDPKRCYCGHWFKLQKVPFFADKH